VIPSERRGAERQESRTEKNYDVACLAVCLPRVNLSDPKNIPGYITMFKKAFRVHNLFFPRTALKTASAVGQPSPLLFSYQADRLTGNLQGTLPLLNLILLPRLPVIPPLLPLPFPPPLSLSWFDIVLVPSPSSHLLVSTAFDFDFGFRLLPSPYKLIVQVDSLRNTHSSRKSISTGV
jgi:hypothetical protein